MPVLTSSQRKTLDDTCVRGRRASEAAVRAALGSLAVAADRPPAHLTEDDRQLRRGLRAKARQLGDVGDELELLIAECAYEQWHRLLFARFLAENNLLIHPDYRAPVTLEDCEELAESLGEPDGWSVAGRFAAEILPGIFRLDDPCIRLRLAPEGRLELEGIVAGLPAEIFIADDALGWVYQFWQRERKDEVNRSERKIGGADLGPVTQLFTENYMVRFLLENSLGAWWAARHRDSPLLKEWDYLRFDAEGRPAAGSFDGWPERVAEVTVMDPCCGSGHFLVEAFRMLWKMRVEEEGLAPVDAQDAVLRDNLFGLELDPRCVQIAMFAVALQAWKSDGGWRPLPVPNIACSGIRVRAPVDEWKAVADGGEGLENALARLHVLFRDADTLGSLIDPKRTTEVTDPTGLQTSLEDVNWDEIAPLLARALAQEAADPATDVLGADAAGIARAASYLSRSYALVTTNYPYLKRGSQTDFLKDYLSRFWPDQQADLSTALYARWSQSSGSAACMLPQNWLTNARYRGFRRGLLDRQSIAGVVRLGAGAFQAISGEVVQPVLLITTGDRASDDHDFFALDVADEINPARKAERLETSALQRLLQSKQQSNPDHRIALTFLGGSELLAVHATAWQGIASSDYARFGRKFWEVPSVSGGWRLQQSTVPATRFYGGREHIIFWENGYGAMTEVCQPGAQFRGKEAWGRSGVVVSQMGDLPVTLYRGECFDNNTAVITVTAEELLPAVWAFCSSEEFAIRVREIDQSLKVTNSALTRVPFDLHHWCEVADATGPLPPPWSADATQWLFDGRPDVATEPLQVGVGRLVGYRWPEQASDADLAVLADEDGIVCLPSVRGERTAGERLQELLARAFGGTWSPARTQELLVRAGSKKKDLDAWLRDEFFKAHCQVFKNRPFIWQIWDGRKDGFSTLVNYHRLDRPTLEKLTYSYLGDWIERQVAGVRDDVAGAEERLAAARALQAKLELILDGEPPYGIYVRWKSLAEQPIGWDPDLNDGVRLNVRPFVEAGVLRAKFNVKWDTDRGKNPDGSARRNDRRFTTAEKRAARGEPA